VTLPGQTSSSASACVLGTLVRCSEALLDGRPALRVAVRDNGPGLTPEQRQRIFDPFFTTKTVGEGTGLGLSISYEIVKKHGGEILVESPAAGGAVFTVRLPIVRKAQA